MGDVWWKICGGYEEARSKGALGVQELRKGRWHVIGSPSQRLFAVGSRMYSTFSRPNGRTDAEHSARSGVLLV